MDKDFYKILGLSDSDKTLSKDEFNKKLKTNFRQLSLKWHPDKFSGKSESEKKEAEEKFKEISEAYNTLSDEKKRQQYDFGGGSGFDPFERFRSQFEKGFNPFDDFNPFGEQFTNTVTVGEDVTVDINVTLDEIYNNAKKTITYLRPVKCKHCNGTGSEDGKLEKCHKCGGTGQIKDFQRFGNTTMVRQGICPECRGTGKIVKNHCTCCGGSGFELEEKEITISVPSGVVDGNYINIEGNGGESNDGGPNGNLIIIFRVINNGEFKVDGYNLLKDVNISIYDALVGCEKEIKCIDGKTVKIKIHELSKDGSYLKVSGKGMKTRHGGLGDLYVKINYIMPGKLTDKQKELLKEIGI